MVVCEYYFKNFIGNAIYVKYFLHSRNATLMYLDTFP